MQIELDTKVMQADFGCQTRLKASQVMRAFPCQTKGVQELVVGRLDDLSDSRQPTTQRFRPSNALTPGMRRSHQVDVSLCLPALTWVLSGKALVCYIAALSRPADTRQLRGWGLTNGK